MQSSIVSAVLAASDAKLQAQEQALKAKRRKYLELSAQSELLQALREGPLPPTQHLPVLIEDVEAALSEHDSLRRSVLSLYGRCGESLARLGLRQAALAQELIQFMQKEVLELQPTINKVSVDFLASECAALLHKMTHTELHVRANTYRSDDVRALAQVQDGLKALDQQIKTQTQEARQRLGSYQSLGEPFEALVTQWWALGDKITHVHTQLRQFEEANEELDAWEAAQQAEEALQRERTAAQGFGEGGNEYGDTLLAGYYS